MNTDMNLNTWIKIPSVFTDSMDMTSCLIFAVSFLLVLFYMYLPKSPIPGPFALPIIGNLPLLFRAGENRNRIFTELHKIYGDVVRLYLGPYLVVVLNGYDNIHEAFVKNAHKFSDRPNWLPDIKRRRQIGKGFIWENGESWKKMRRYALQSMRDFGVGKKSLEEVILDEANNISNILTAKEGQEIKDVKNIMTAASCNVIHHVAFGFRYNHDDEKFQQLLHAFDVIFKAPGPLITSFIPSWFGSLGSRLSGRREKMERILHYITTQIEEHEEQYDENNLRDFVDLHIQAKNSGENNKDNSLLRVILELFAAGTDTTGTTLDWAFLYMIAYPEVQKKCVDEIHKITGNSRSVSVADKRSLPFVEATLMEVQRMANIASGSLPHTCTEDTVIDGYNIPRGAIVLGNLTSAHFDPRYWENSKDFLPERFINQNTGNVIKNEHLAPFSMGPRICPGESLAKMEMFVVFTNLIQKYEFSKFLEEDVLSFDGITGVTTCAPPYRLKVKAR